MLPYPLIAGNNQLVVHLERKSVVDVNTFEICTSSDAYSLEAAEVIVCRLVFQREATTRESGEGLPSLCSGVVAVSG